jgi:Spy/CpxP family protein refolding chaperone
MKNLRQLCASVVLTLALAAAASAGTIHTGVTSPPPPAQPASMAEGQTGTEQTDGTIHTGKVESEPEADTVAEIALNLLQSVLSLF